MKIPAVASLLLHHFSPEEREIPDHANYPGRNAAALEAINGAFQEVFQKGSPWVRRDDRGAILKAPTTVTVTALNGSTAATITGWKAWMAGCAIVIDGHDVDNEIRNDSSTAILKYPYNGNTGTRSATVYQTSITVGSDVMEIEGPIRADYRTLIPAPTPITHGTSFRTEDFGFTGTHHPITNPVRVADRTGPPIYQSIDTWSKSDVDPAKLRIRLYPAPAADGVIEYRVMLAPPVMTAITPDVELPVPFGFVETIFLPIARQKLTASPFFIDSTTKEEIGRAYQNALGALADLNPRKQSGVKLRPAF